MITCMTSAELLSCALLLGRRLLECGAEIYRVELLSACAYLTATECRCVRGSHGIIATIRIDEEEILTQTSRIKQRGTDLDKVAALNGLCRAVCTCPVSYGQFQKDMQQIEARPQYSKQVQVFCLRWCRCLFYATLRRQLHRRIAGIYNWLFASNPCLVHRATIHARTVYQSARWCMD